MESLSPVLDPLKWSESVFTSHHVGEGLGDAAGMLAVVVMSNSSRKGGSPRATGCRSSSCALFGQEQRRKPRPLPVSAVSPSPSLSPSCCAPSKKFPWSGVDCVD